MQSESDRFFELGLQMSQIIERRLGVKYATWVHPQDLAMIGLAVYGERQDTKFLYLNPKDHAHDMVSGFRDETLQKLGITKRELEVIYPTLVGNGDYSQNAVANALTKADQVFSPDEFRQFQGGLAALTARYLKIKPDIIKDPNVRLDIQGGRLRFSSGLEYPLPLPDLVIEYGPGAVTFKKLPAEIRRTGCTVLIEDNYYINELLYSGALLYGMSTPQVITRMDGIKSATGEILSQNPEGLANDKIPS